MISLIRIITLLPGRPRLRLLAAAVIALLAVAAASKVFPTGEVPAGAPLEEFTAHLDRRIPAVMSAYGIPGLSIALIREGETVWAEAYGYADLETGRKMSVDTYCRLESISKSVTAWGVMSLAEEGRIDLDRPVQEYLHSWRLPESEFSTEKVTARRLLSGSAGMPLGTIGEYYHPEEENIPGLRQILSREARLFREPGTGFFYSNTGFNILEVLIEDVTGRDFAAYMEEEVLQPLGMEGASFQWRANFDPPVANGYGSGGEKIPVYVYPYRAAGGLFGRAEDVARFAAAGAEAAGLNRSPVLEAETVDAMYRPVSEMSGYYRLVFDGYGLGHFVEHLCGASARSPQVEGAPGMVRAVSHGGQGTGWMTDFHLLPESGDGIVILANSQRTWPGFAYILSDWATWLGYESIGMGVIVKVQRIAWAAVALVLTAALWQLLRLAEGLLSGKRRFAPSLRISRPLRAAQLTVALLLLGTYLRISTLQYWFIDSVLPIASVWINLSMVTAALVLIAAAVLPRTGTSGRGAAGPGSHNGSPVRSYRDRGFAPEIVMSSMISKAVVMPESSPWISPVEPSGVERPRSSKETAPPAETGRSAGSSTAR